MLLYSLYTSAVNSARLRLLEMLLASGAGARAFSAVASSA
jgi:hypothetical protein